MGILRPVAMEKIGLVGLKEDREALLTVLHDRGVIQVETPRRTALELMPPERASELQRTVAEELLRFRGLRMALPQVPTGPPRAYANLDEVLSATRTIRIDARVGELKREEDHLLTQRKAVEEELDLLERFAFYQDRFDLLSSKNVLSFFGEASSKVFETFRTRVDLSEDVRFLVGPPSEPLRFLAIIRSSAVESFTRTGQALGIRLIAAPPLKGSPAEERPRLIAERARVDTRLAEIRSELLQGSQWYYTVVVALEEALAIENRKLEVYTRMGAGRESFVLEGWIPRRELGSLEQELDRVTRGRTFFYLIPTDEEPPTLMDNPRGIRRFEFFVRFYSLPLADEWDPTLVFSIVFPIFFGFMLGDVGYGIVILGFCIWMIRGFPGRQYVPKGLKNFLKLIMGPSAMQQLAYALLPGCAIAIGLGVIFNAFFGHPFLPFTIADPVKNVGKLLLFAGYVGLAMVTLGFLLGLLRAYFQRHYQEAIGKFGGILFSWGIAALGLTVLGVTPWGKFSPSNPVDLVSFGLLAGGTLLLVVGNEAMALIEIVSHILSYTRLVGILLASAILALVVNTLASMEFTSGAAFVVGGVIFGVVILVGGQLFNLVIAVFEPGIQGARLIFVEHFSKYYHGNGRPFRPFGSRRTFTTASSLPASPQPASGAPRS